MPEFIHYEHLSTQKKLLQFKVKSQGQKCKLALTKQLKANLLKLFTSSLTHWWFGSIINCFGFCWVHHNFFQPFQLVFREILSRLDVLSCFCIHVIVRDYLDKLWKMVWIPFSIPRKKSSCEYRQTLGVVWVGAVGQGRPQAFKGYLKGVVSQDKLEYSLVLIVSDQPLPLPF